MTCRRFQFIWRNFHINDPSSDDEAQDGDDEENEVGTNIEEEAEDEFVEIQLERVQQE